VSVSISNPCYTAILFHFRPNSKSSYTFVFLSSSFTLLFAVRFIQTLTGHSESPGDSSNNTLPSQRYMLHTDEGATAGLIGVTLTADTTPNLSKSSCLKACADVWILFFYFYFILFFNFDCLVSFVDLIPICFYFQESTFECLCAVYFPPTDTSVARCGYVNMRYIVPTEDNCISFTKGDTNIHLPHCISFISLCAHFKRKEKWK
jgi:hypothetical protein